MPLALCRQCWKAHNLSLVALVDGSLQTYSEYYALESKFATKLSFGYGPGLTPLKSSRLDTLQVHFPFFLVWPLVLCEQGQIRSNPLKD